MPENPLLTLWFNSDDDLNVDDEVLASGQSASAAAKLIREHGSSTTLHHSYDYDAFRCFELVHLQTQSEGLRRTVLAATVPKTPDREADKKLAVAMIDIQTIDRHREFWSGRISTDENFQARLDDIAQRRAVLKLDQKITTSLVDALLASGYTITCCIRDVVPEFNRSTDREGILELLFNLDLAELHVHRERRTSWIMLSFGESGWDVIADYSSSLEDLIDPIVDPHLPWNQPGAEKDRGFEVIVMPSPDDLGQNEPQAQAEFDAFVRAVERIL